MPHLLEGWARNILLLRAEPYRNRVHGDLSRLGGQGFTGNHDTEEDRPRCEPGRHALEWRQPVPCKEIPTGLWERLASPSPERIFLFLPASGRKQVFSVQILLPPEASLLALPAFLS